MIIAIASGKGGTGKTTVAVSLAQCLADQSPLLVDCDVEEPNVALFLKPTITERRQVGQLVPEIDTERCTYCGRCAEVCQYHALAVIGQKVLVFPELCHSCGSCALNCPGGAISEKVREVGIIERGTSGSIAFAQGILNVGEAMASPVIRQLKRWVIPSNKQNTLVLLDVPPGTSCPVVESLRGADVVVLVTEPTPFGLHDLRLAVEVARDRLRQPVVAIINRDSVGDPKVTEYCLTERIPILMRIPLDRRIAEAYSDGISLIQALPEYKAQFLKLYERIHALVRGAT